MLSLINLWGGGFGLPETFALAVVAAIGYLYGRRRKGDPTDGANQPDELARAADIARQLEAVAATLRGDLARHHSEVERFKRAVHGAGGAPDEAAWAAIRDEAERVLAPTLQLVGKVASAYDQIRQQTQALSSFSGGRTDSLTGLCNSRALGELLEVELSGHAATHDEFSVAIFGVGQHAEGATENRAEQQARVLRAAELLRPQLRDTDLAARYGIDELVVVMPHTRLYGATIFGRRVRELLAAEGGESVSCGLAQSMPGDTASALLTRADSALYSARAAGGGQYLHNGRAIRQDETSPAQAAVAPVAADEPAGDPEEQPATLQFSATR